MAIPAIVAGVSTVIPYIYKILTRVIPDPIERDKAQGELAQLAINGELQLITTQLSAIIAEANSEDKWTSRARPSFLYVVYTLILTAIPMGILHAYSPATAMSIAEGFKQWLAAMPEALWWLFGTGYLGYTGAREVGKAKKVDFAKWVIQQNSGT